MTKMVFAIIDTVANDIVGPLWTMQHAAPAIRAFGDIATKPMTGIHEHPGDFQLVKLGHITDDLRLLPDFEIILTGDTWLASQQREQPQG